MIKRKTDFISFEWGNYNVAIYGDGKYEYDGYFEVIIDEFDDDDKPTQRKRVLYFKAPNIIVLAEAIKHNIHEFWISRDYSKHVVSVTYNMS